MKTIVFNMKETVNQDELKKVATLIRNGETVAFPTETVYGLGADARSEDAVKKIFQAKGRPSDNPLIVHVARKEQLFSLVKDAPSYVAALVEAFSPGPITYVLESAGKVAPTVTAGLHTVGVRIPDHPVALAILEEVNLPIAAPSANRSGRPSPTEAAHVAEDLTNKIAAIVDGGRTNVGIESTVVDCTGQVPLILRLGAIRAEDIAKVVGACDVYGKKESVIAPKSPGMKYVHYAPEVPLILVNKEKLEDVIRKYRTQGKKIGLLYASDDIANFQVEKITPIGRDEKDVAKRLYGLLRSFRRQDVDVIICEYPTFVQDDAILDRLERAATEIIKSPFA